MVNLIAPDFVGGREAAQQWLADLPNLSHATVKIDFSELIATSPSFIDEVVRIILADGGARRLKLQNVSAEVSTWAHDSSTRRGVVDRLMVDVKA